MRPEARRDFPVPVPVTLRPARGTARSEYAVNLSGGGVCLHLREPLAEGEAVEVRLTVPPDGLRIEARGVVVWTSRHTAADAGARFWEVGVRFEAMDPGLRADVEGWARRSVDRRR
jgi:hypothetical protein